MPWLTETLPTFGERLGAVLFRVPGEVKRQDERLAGLLAAWPRSIPLVIEAQHESWHVDETFDALRAAGAVMCTTDLDELDDAARHPADRPVPVPAAAPHRLRRRGARRMGEAPGPVHR